MYDSIFKAVNTTLLNSTELEIVEYINDTDTLNQQYLWYLNKK